MDNTELTVPFVLGNREIKLIELFGGIGTQSMALKRLGLIKNAYRYVEFDPYVVKSYNAIHDTNFETTDVRNVNGLDLGVLKDEKSVYVLTYSFPCTDISVAGKMKGYSRDANTRSGLLWEVERLLKECKQLTENDSNYCMPDVLLMENVPQVHSAKNLSNWKEWLDVLKSLGYTTYYKDLNAKEYGVPQSRNRCIAVSLLGNFKFEFPKTIGLRTEILDHLEENVERKYYINNTKSHKLINSLIGSGELPENLKEIGVDLSIKTPVPSEV